MKRLFAGFVLASMLVFSQACPALAATSNIQFRPTTQYSSVGANTQWTLSWSSSGWASWWFDYGDGQYSAGTTAGSVSLVRSHRFGGCGRYWQSLSITDYTIYPYTTFTYIGWTYIYCS